MFKQSAWLNTSLTCGFISFSATDGIVDMGSTSEDSGTEDIDNSDSDDYEDS